MPVLVTLQGENSPILLGLQVQVIPLIIHIIISMLIIILAMEVIILLKGMEEMEGTHEIHGTVQIHPAAIFLITKRATQDPIGGHSPIRYQRIDPEITR